MLYSVRTDAWTPLTPRVFETLLFLVRQPGVVTSRAALMKAVWPDVIVEENNLDQSISALRHLLGERDGEHPISSRSEAEAIVSLRPLMLLRHQRLRTVRLERRDPPCG